MRADFRSDSASAFRVWSETVPLGELAAAGGGVFPLLRRFGVSLLAAVRPWEIDQVPRLLGTARDAGVPVGLWPMLADGEGRWASLENGESFVAFALRVLDAAGPSLPTELAVDLEPPFARLQRWVALRPAGADVGRSLAATADLLARRWATRAKRGDARPSDLWGAGAAPYERLLAELDARGVASSATVAPLVLLDPPGWPIFQAALGTPLESLPWGRVTVMLYTSLFEGWSPRIGDRRALDRRRSLALLRRCAAATRARFGSGAGVSLGAVGVGALGTEPVYRDAHELADDVLTARTAGVRDLSLLDLGGVLARGPAERWLAALTDER